MHRATLTTTLRHKLRAEKSTYRQLAARLDVPAPSLWRFLNGRGGLNLATVEKLMRHYRLAVTQLPSKRKPRPPRTSNHSHP
jgi:transcriptional regulator with XRE-family HTH domain